METLRRLAVALRNALLSLWVVLLPERFRRSSRLTLASSTTLDRWSLALGLVLLGLGLWVFAVGLGTFMRDFADRSSRAFWEKAQSDASVDFEDKLAFYWSGAIGWISYMFTPRAWLGTYLMAEGLYRFTAWAVAAKAVGSPAIALALALSSRLRTEVRVRSRLRRLGPGVEDRVEPNTGGDPRWTVEVLASRDKPWRPELTIELDERLYELVETRERVVAGRLRIAYRLAPWPENRLVRQVVRYDPPGGDLPAAGEPAAAPVPRRVAGEPPVIARPDDR